MVINVTRSGLVHGFGPDFELIKADKIFAKICLKADKIRLNILNHCSTMSSESHIGLKSLIYLLGKDFSDSVFIYLIVVVNWGLNFKRLFSCGLDSEFYCQQLVRSQSV
jgi:hypothetical protein